MIQVASGLLRGMQLRSPEGKQTRPSSERLRQAIFNVLRHYRWNETVILDAAQVADVFAGTGAWGIEALSNGAGGCAFVESHASALKTLRHNTGLVAHAFEAQHEPARDIQVWGVDVLRAYKKLPECRVVFCDPPYGKDFFEKIAALEEEHSRVIVGGLMLFEADQSEELPSPGPSLQLFDRKIYGDSAVHFYVKRSR